MSVYFVEKAVPYYDQIYNSMKSMIIQGVFQPGDRIYEAQIARKFNVSRSPVREAVRALEKEGLLLIDEKSRITVYKPNMKDVEEIYQCRMALESLAAKLTAKSASKEEVKEIEKVIIETEKQMKRKDEASKEAMIALNSQFHDLILRFSNNKRLQKQLSGLRSLTYYYMSINIHGDNRKLLVFQDHKEIFNHIKKGDDVKAGLTMEQHIGKDLEHLKKLVKG